MWSSGSRLYPCEELVMVEQGFLYEAVIKRCLVMESEWGAKLFYWVVLGSGNAESGAVADLENTIVEGH